MQSSGKLEKAEILEMTVQYLRALHSADFPRGREKGGQGVCATQSPGGGSGNKAVSQGPLSGCCGGRGPESRESSGGTGEQGSGDAGSEASSQVGRGEVRLLRQRRSLACVFSSLQAGKRGAGPEWKPARKRDGRGLASALGSRSGRGHSQFSLSLFSLPLQQSC